MIIYGWRPSHLKTSQSKTIECPECGQKGKTIISIYSKYAHVFWIPLFPFGKTGASQCQNCNCLRDEKTMSAEIKKEYNEIARYTRPPIWQFIGILILAISIALFIGFQQNEKANEQKYILNPMIGDVPEYRTETGGYSTFKITEVTQDSIIYVVNLYETNQMSGIKEIIEDTCYSDTLYIMSRYNLAEMYNEGTIYDINRD